jgi:hypothetical protein
MTALLMDRLEQVSERDIPPSDDGDRVVNLEIKGNHLCERRDEKPGSLRP